MNIRCLAVVIHRCSNVLVLDDQQRRVLEYIHALNTGGYRPTHDEVEEWRLRPTPKPGKRGELISPAEPSPITAGVVLNFLQSSSVWSELSKRALAGMDTSALFGGKAAVYGPSGPPESFLACLVRLSWLSELGIEDRLGLTDLGRALLRAEQQNDQEEADVMVLAKDDPMAYAQLVGRIADMDSPLIVDPYLRAEQLLSFLQYTSANRFLIGPFGKEKDVAAMQVLIESTGWAVSPELRRATDNVLHDRYLLDDTRVYTLGISMNAVGSNKTTTLMPLPDHVADVVRQEVNEHWEAATVLAPSSSSSSPVVAEKDLDDE